MSDTKRSAAERWEANLANGSEVYASVSGRRLRAFCRQMKTSPEELATISVKELRNLLEDYLSLEKKRGHSGEYIRSTVKAVRSWREYNQQESPRGLKIPNLRLRPRLDAEQAPTTEDLRRVLLAAAPAERVAVALVAFCGLRLQVLGNHSGSDGLTVADFPEMSVQGARVVFEKVPTLVRVRASSSKAGHSYVTFLGPEGCRYLAESLSERARSGERIGPTTDIVSPKSASKRFMTTINVGDRMRRPMRACGVQARPYSWRSYFIQKALESQSATGGAVPDRFVEAWAGHVGDVSSRHYGVGKPNLPASLLDEMRTAYSRLAPFLETTVEKPRADAETGFKRTLLSMIGLSDKEAAKVSAASKEEFVRILRERLGAGAALEAGGELAPAGAAWRGPQRPVSPEDAEKLLSEGWTYVDRWPDGRVLLQEPVGR